MTPPALDHDHAIRRCLAKDPDERWQTSRDLLFELKGVAEAATAGQPAAVKSPALANRERLAWFAATFLLLVVLSIGYLHRSTLPASPAWSYILPSEKTTFSNFGGPLAMSPDGQKLAFVARTAGGMDLLWVRPLDAGWA